MNEFALHKGYLYATVALDAQRMRVLCVGEGNNQAATRPFFEALGAEGCAQIEAAAMDMNTAMELDVRAQCLNAEAVYDLFHVAARFGREVVVRCALTKPTRCATLLRSAKSSSVVVGCCCKITITAMMNTLSNLTSYPRPPGLVILLPQNHQCIPRQSPMNKKNLSFSDARRG
ncbi:MULTISPECIES: transposase [unclassified Janthinobacterium]|uniref:transposase n=1 Tax=unclassified Janthinobacterium TaxID=2610881 RepID=UPI0018C99F07|nr:transposase [Janthinobacterium sp. CG_23.4]MDH6156911.1 hypothetical protein [Janthinobacterium sp. CG_23.4]